MQAAKARAARVTIPIELETADNPKSGVRRGTFTSPWPKVLVKKNDLVRWQIKKGQAFELRFMPCEGTVARSPFKKAKITDQDAFLPVINEGHFHYKVRVTHATSGAKFEIKHCPEFGVGN
jgi:hypothetical protein